QGGRRVARHHRGEIPLVRAGMVAKPGGIHHERLVRLPAVVAAPPQAPRERYLILVARPGAGHVEPGDGVEPVLPPAGDLPVVALVLLAVAVGVPGPGRHGAAEGIAPPARGDIDAALDPGVVAALPDVVRGTGEAAGDAANAGGGVGGAGAGEGG